MKGDVRAVEGLPLRLMLVALLVSLTVPTMLSVMGHATEDVSSREMATIAGDVAGTVEEMSAAGPGNVRIIDLPSVPAGMGLLIGGEEGSVDCMRISWCSDSEVLGSRYLEGASVISEDGPIELSSGDTLRLVCGQDGIVRVAVP